MLVLSGVCFCECVVFWSVFYPRRQLKTNISSDLSIIWHPCRPPSFKNTKGFSIERYMIIFSKNPYRQTSIFKILTRGTFDLSQSTIDLETLLPGRNNEDGGY